MADEPAWTFGDAWVLTAIAMHGDEGCDLAGLLSAADASNHAILDEDEVSQGVGRLVASGLVTVEGQHFALTPLGKVVAGKRRGGLIGQVRSMHGLLAKQRLTEGSWRVPAGSLDAAYAAYISRTGSSG